MKIYIKKSILSNFELLETPDKELGKGGQARVFKIQTKGYEDYCLKKFIREEDAQKNYDRIAYMIQNPPQNIMGSSSFRICWPTAFAYDMQKNFIGYIMPLAFSNSRDLKILEVYNAKPISQQTKYKKYPDWFDKYELDTDKGLKNRMKMLCNWAIAIYSLHETNKYVIVDLKPENVMATASGKISIVDTDSFQISENGKILFPGVAYTPGYFPPEGKFIKQNNKPFPITCDCFAAAVCFYKILTGVHPYGGTIKKAPYNELEKEEEFINAGLFAYGDKMNYLSFNADFNLHKHFDNLPPVIQTLFKRAFGRDAEARPAMDEWGKALHEAAISNMNLIRSTVKPQKINSLSIQILNVEFSDADYDGNIIRDYGNTLYTDIAYLCPKITYKVLKASSNIELSYKIYTPSGVLMSGTSSRPGFTNTVLVPCPYISDFVQELQGWGNNNKTAYDEAGKWCVEFYEGDKCIYKTYVVINAKTVSKPYTPPQKPYTPPKTPYTPFTPQKKKSKLGNYLWFLLFFIILWAGYQFWYKDYKRDKDAPRTYVFADNLFMRSTAVADVEYNRLGTIPYGSELITYSEENGWAYVKTNGETGYVSKDFILNAQDFHLLNGVWGNNDAKEVVATSKCRLAVLDYLKSGNLKTGSTGWQIFTKQKEMKPNSVLFPRLNNGYDNFTEFAFIIKNNENGSRKLVLYSFKEDESPVFVYSEDAPEQGDIKSISYNRWNNKYNVTYSRSNSYIPQPKKVVKTVVKQESSLTISSVAFANTDYNRNIITNYGQQLYTNMQYLQPKVFYKKSAVGTTKIKLQVKIIRPDGTVIRGKTSPVDYTFEQEVNLSGTNGYIELMGWGNNEGGVYSEGDYKYEIWSEGKKLFSTIVYIKNKVDSISITAVSFANVTYDGKTLNKYGEQLYCTTQYLQSRFHYTKKKDTTEQITLQIKIFKSNGEMLSGASSPIGFTFEQKVTLSGKSGTCTILGWGNKSGTSYSVGNYRYEIWMNDNELLSTSIVTFK